MQTREEYDNWLLQFTTNYVLTKKMGRRYAKAYFKTLEEAKNINKSLTTLGKVIVALTDKKA